MWRLVLVVCAGCSFELRAIAVDDAKPGDAQGDTPAEAATDGEAFDPALCPTGYANTGVTASPNSRYRLTDSDATFAAQHTDCNDDRPGWTHLVSLDTREEAQQIRATITPMTYYAGVVQPVSSGSASAGWLLFTGNTMSPALWQTGQPNDNNSGGENNEQNFAAADDGTGLLNDVSGNNTYRGVCECDGLPIPPAVANVIASQ